MHPLAVVPVQEVRRDSGDGAAPIELVDGQRLVDLFKSLELGLVPRVTYDVDAAFFSQFESDDEELS